ncbi:uncharacterized protein LOC134832222 [Culicoides brevitarsis]|uniref:uncharacterized protein LOC134832222 n=1 Tax=Culicoides brevitarsis TaxID=469753 RepID=UPI00307B9673
MSNDTKPKSTQTLEEWKEFAIKQQKEFASSLSDQYWDRYCFEITENDLKEHEKSNWFTRKFVQKQKNYEVHQDIEDEMQRKMLFRKISHAIYGLPKEDSKVCDLNEKQQELVHDIMKKCMKHSVSREYVDFACINVSVFFKERLKIKVPLFRVRSIEEESKNKIKDCKFIDHKGRVYDSFDNYKKDNIHNKWDKAYLCFPKDGYYTEKQEFVFHDTEKPKRTLEEWKKLAVEQQTVFANSLSDRNWDRFRFEITENDLKEPEKPNWLIQKINEYQNNKNNGTLDIYRGPIVNLNFTEIESPRNKLFQKISYAIYGAPKDESATCGLNEKEQELVNEIMIKCMKHSVSREYVDFACIFVSIFLTEETQIVVPLFRVRSIEEESKDKIKDCKFIDHYGRVYDSFDIYKEDNTWDKAYLCFPKDGYYTEKQEFVFHDQQTRGSFNAFIEKASIVTGVGATVGTVGGLVMTLFPATAPIAATVMTCSAFVGAPGAIFGTGKSIATLVDRVKHEKSINFSDSEARSCWLMTATSAISVGTLASTRILVAASRGGNLVSGWARAGVTGLMGANVTLSGANFLNMTYNLYEKNEAGEEITRLEIFQLTTSFFFFTHSAVNFKTANSIVKDIHGQEAESLRMSINKKSQKYFDEMQKAYKETVKPGKFSELEGQAQFVREMIKIDDLKGFYKQIQMTPDRQFRINKEYTMSARKFVTLTNEQRSNIMTNSQQLNSGKISLEQFIQNTQNIRKEVRIRSDRETMEAATNLKEKYGIDVKKFKINGKNHKLSPAEIHELHNLYKNVDVETISYAKEFADNNANTPNEYNNAVKYAIRNIESKVDQLENQSKQKATQEIVKNLRETNELDSAFKSSCKEYESNSSKVKFCNSKSAANHFDKHGQKFGNDPEAMKAYNETAAKLMKSNPTDEVWTPDGEGVKKTYQVDGEKCVTFTEMKNGKLGEEVVLTLYKKNVPNSSTNTQSSYFDVFTNPNNYFPIFESIFKHFDINGQTFTSFLINFLTSNEQYANIAHLVLNRNPATMNWKVVENGLVANWFEDMDDSEYKITYTKTDDSDKEGIISLYKDNECVMADVYVE